jgi:lipoyl(octanoyl) transferase
VSSLRFERSGIERSGIERSGIERSGFEQAWARQRELHAQVAAGKDPDTVLLLEHTAVYTAGKRTEPHERPVDGTPVIDVDRGGKITWHGPGQLVGYPIVRLADPIDVVAYVRRLEQVLIEVCTELGVAAERVEGRSGVWVSTSGQSRERKLAAIGIRVARGVTMHGFALNCNPDLSWYTRIVPCGIPDAGVTSLSEELHRDVTVAQVVPLVERQLAACDLAGRTTRAATSRTVR